MIHLVARRIRPDQRDCVAAWPREVDGPRRAEALESLAAEGVTHETAMIIDTRDGPVIVSAMEAEDLAHSMRAADDGPAKAKVVLDLRPA